MAGNQVRGLIAASKTRGWDPTVIPGFGSMANFDKDPGQVIIDGPRPVGDLPGGNPDGWYAEYDSEHPSMTNTPKDVFDSPSFNHPDVSRENVSRGSGTALPVNRAPSERVTPVLKQLPGPQADGTTPLSVFDVPFSTPNLRENRVNRTTKANPYPDMPGA